VGEDYKKQAYEQPQSEERPAWVSPHQPMMGEWYRLASRQVPPMPPKGAQVDSRAYLRQKIV
jgi:hypothetical protein